MKRLYTLLVSTVFFCISATVVAQSGTLTGKLVDEKGIAIPYANVSLLKVFDSSFTVGALTDNDGKFSMATPAMAKYFLRFTSIGFAESKTEAFDVSAADFSHDFGTITMSVSKKTLKEVTVQSLRPTIKQLADRMVVSIEGTALAAGNTAFDVLARAPGVFVDQEGNIQLNGRGGVTVMLDGRLTYLSGRQLRTLLEGMPAENLKNIEIITNPSAKYDAEGSSGMLNINLKKNDQQGMNGSVYASYLYNFANHGYSGGGNINYKAGKWNSFLNLDFQRRVGGREATFTRIFYTPQRTTFFDQTATGGFAVVGPPSVRLGTDYSINKSHSVGFMANYTRNTAKEEFFTNTYIGNSTAAPFLHINAANIAENTYRNMTTNLHYTGKLDTAGTLLTADVDYVNIRNKGEANFYNYYDTLNSSKPVTKDFLYTYTPNGFDIYSAKVDYSKPLSKDRKLEFGAKASRVISDNDSRFYFNNTSLTIDPLRTNHFNYKENIYAAYVNVNGNLNKNISVQSGLRVEHTKSVGNLITTGQVTEREYTNLFPSLFVQQKVSANYGINYNYSRRIRRPNYGNLNPFRFYRDPYTYVEGTPFLRPQFAHLFSITQTFKKNYSLVVLYQHTKDVISELPRLDLEKATTIYYTGNGDRGNYVSVAAIAPIRITKKWESQNTFTSYYNSFNINSANGALQNNKVTYMVQSNHTLLLPLDFRVELNLMYRSSSASGLYMIDPMSRVDAGIKKSIMKKKVDISINANDIFKGMRYRFDTDINGNINNFDQYLRFRNVGITLRYNFSKGQKVDSKRRNNSFDELNRTGG